MYQNKKYFLNKVDRYTSPNYNNIIQNCRKLLYIQQVCMCGDMYNFCHWDSNQWVHVQLRNFRFFTCIFKWC